MKRNVHRDTRRPAFHLWVLGDVRLVIQALQNVLEKTRARRFRTAASSFFKAVKATNTLGFPSEIRARA
jgi:hypothetical protein